MSLSGLLTARPLLVRSGGRPDVVDLLAAWADGGEADGGTSGARVAADGEAALGIALLVQAISPGEP